MKPIKPGDRVVVYHGYRRIIGSIKSSRYMHEKTLEVGYNWAIHDTYYVVEAGFYCHDEGPFHRKQIRKLKPFKPKIKSEEVYNDNLDKTS